MNKEEDKLVKSILREREANNSGKKVKKNFKFTLLKLLTKNNPEVEKKIKSAVTNSSKWDSNCIQALFGNALETVFLRSMDILSVEKPGYKAGEDYICYRHLESIMSDWFEDKDELEKEIEDLQDKLEGNGVVSEEEHNNTIKQLKKEHKQTVEDLENKIQKLENTETYLREKIDTVESRMRTKVELEFKCQQSTD